MWAMEEIPYFGQTVSYMASEVVACVPSRIVKTRTVEEALDNRVWVQDIRGGLSLNGPIEFLKLWDALMNFTFTSDDDQHIWKHEISGSFSSKTAYKAFFYGSIQFEPWRRLEILGTSKM